MDAIGDISLKRGVAMRLETTPEYVARITAVAFAALTATACLVVAAEAGSVGGMLLSAFTVCIIIDAICSGTFARGVRYETDPPIYGPWRYCRDLYQRHVIRYFIWEWPRSGNREVHAPVGHYRRSESCFQGVGRSQRDSLRGPGEKNAEVGIKSPERGFQRSDNTWERHAPVGDRSRERSSFRGPGEEHADVGR